jgi:hypothetical protein
LAAGSAAHWPVCADGTLNVMTMAEYRRALLIEKAVRSNEYWPAAGIPLRTRPNQLDKS